MTPDSLQAEDTEWVTIGDTLLRWKRFIVLGVATSWSLLLLGAWFWPRVEDCETTISLPPTYSSSSGSDVALGVPIATYKRVERTVEDGALLESALRDIVPPAEIRRIARDLRRHIAPISGGARDDLQRLDRQDTVVAVKLTYGSRTPGRARSVVDRLERLLRRVIAGDLALQALQRHLLDASTNAAKQALQLADLQSTNKSLIVLEADLRRLSSEFLQAGVAGREVVDVSRGGHRYLPPPLQLVGVRAQRADNEHEQRLAENARDVRLLKAAFLTQASEKIDRMLRGRGNPTDDFAAALDADLAKFLSGRHGVELKQMEAEIGVIVGTLKAQQAATALIQSPTARPRSIALQVAALALLAAMLFPLLALIADIWIRFHRDDTHSRP